MNKIETVTTPKNLVEAVQSAQNTLDLYSNLIHLQGDLQPKWCIMSPYHLPQEATALALAYAMGPSGKLVSADPKGDRNDMNQYNIPWDNIAAGGSEYLRDQLDLLRRNGVPLAAFDWLGEKSNFSHIPVKSGSMDGVADHGNIEYLYKMTHRNKQYIRDGVRAQLQLVRPGEFYVHQGWMDHGEIMQDVFGMTFPEWLRDQGYQVIAHLLHEDAVEVPISGELEKVLQDMIDRNSFGTDMWKLGWYIDKARHTLSFHAGPAIVYPAPYVFVAQNPV